MFNRPQRQCIAATFLVGPSYVIGQYIIAGDAVHSGQLLATQARDNTKVENTKTAKNDEDKARSTQEAVEKAKDRAVTRDPDPARTNRARY